MELIDDTLVAGSKILFEGLQDEDYRILRYLAKDGTLNLTELGQRTSQPKYTYSPFDRWGVKARFTQSQKSVGLITNQYIFAVKINKKETQYGLTIKGIMSILNKVKFEKIFFVKRYKQFLMDLALDKQIVEWGMNFIKSELALIMFYNSANGLIWTKFKSLRKYWDEFKLYNTNFLKNFVISVPFYSTNLKWYESLKNEYLKLFFILDEVTTPIELGIDRVYYDDPIKDCNTLRRFIDRWYLYIDRYDLNNISTSKDNMRDDLVPYYDEEFWYQERKPISREAYKILKKSKFRK